MHEPFFHLCVCKHLRLRCCPESGWLCWDTLHITMCPPMTQNQSRTHMREERGSFNLATRSLGKSRLGRGSGRHKLPEWECAGRVIGATRTSLALEWSEWVG